MMLIPSCKLETTKTPTHKSLGGKASLIKPPSIGKFGAGVWICLGVHLIEAEHCKDQDYYKAQVLASGEGSGIWEKHGLQQSLWKWRKLH